MLFQDMVYTTPFKRLVNSFEEAGSSVREKNHLKV